MPPKRRAAAAPIGDKTSVPTSTRSVRMERRQKGRGNDEEKIILQTSTEEGLDPDVHDPSADEEEKASSIAEPADQDLDGVQQVSLRVRLTCVLTSANVIM